MISTGICARNDALVGGFGCDAGHVEPISSENAYDSWKPNTRKTRSVLFARECTILASCLLLFAYTQSAVSIFSVARCAAVSM